MGGVALANLPQVCQDLIAAMKQLLTSLSSSSPEVKAQLKAIQANATLSQAAILQATVDLINANGNDAQKQLIATIQQNADQCRVQMVTLAESKMTTPEGKALIDQMAAVFNNQALTREQVCEGVKSAVAGASDAALADLANLRPGGAPANAPNPGLPAKLKGMLQKMDCAKMLGPDGWASHFGGGAHGGETPKA